MEKKVAYGHLQTISLNIVEEGFRRPEHPYSSYCVKAAWPNFFLSFFSPQLRGS